MRVLDAFGARYNKGKDFCLSPRLLATEQAQTLQRQYFPLLLPLHDEAFMVSVKIRRHSRICVILLCYYFGTICLSLKGKAFADQPLQESHPNTNVYLKSKADVDEARVRIGLRLTPYGSGSCQRSPCAPGQEARPTSVVRYTLRAHISKPNHFFFRGFHIETTPLNWNRKSNTYAIKLSIAKLYGQQGEVEERLGELTLQGKLLGEGGVYVLHGATAKQFKNKFSQPILDMVAGYQAMPVKVSSQLSKRSLPKSQRSKHLTTPPHQRDAASQSPTSTASEFKRL